MNINKDILGLLESSYLSDIKHQRDKSSIERRFQNIKINIVHRDRAQNHCNIIYRPYGPGVLVVVGSVG